MKDILNKEYLYQAYVVEKKSSKTIATEAECHPCTVIEYLRRFGVPVRTIGEAHKGIRKGIIPVNVFKDGKENINYIERETRTCKCGCDETFMCRVNSVKRFVSGHNWRGKKRGPLSDDEKLNISIMTKNGMNDPELRKKLSLLKGGTGIPGENSEYGPEWTNELRESIRCRDNYTCQICGMTEEEHLIVFGETLTVHHIDYNKKNSVEENLTSLCHQCHTRTNCNREYWKEYFGNKLNKVIVETGNGSSSQAPTASNITKGETRNERKSEVVFITEGSTEIALLKSGELLGGQETDYQQPSRKVNTEGSETRNY